MGQVKPSIDNCQRFQTAWKTTRFSIIVLSMQSPRHDIMMIMINPSSINLETRSCPTTLPRCLCIAASRFGADTDRWISTAKDRIGSETFVENCAIVTVPPLCCFPLQHLQPSTSLSLGFRILQPAPPSEITCFFLYLFFFQKWIDCAKHMFLHHV